jgi:RNase H-like domain found in reverse transcriptase/Integrase zinc binding domain/Chromo (CHRromatin Organisation MOdifier) domain/Integrase core domain
MEKSQFNLPEVQYLGHIVGRDGLKVDPKKVEAVKNWPRPETVTQVRSFIGFVNYFRRFIDHFSERAAPLNELLKGASKKHARVTWTSACQKAFEELKTCLTTAPVLVVPDFSKPFVVEADASNQCLGAVLLQEGHPVAYESRTFLPAERNYHTPERELTAVVHALKIWRCYLWGSRFTIYSDHEPLKYLHTKATLTARQARWCEFLSGFDFIWVYKKGSTMMADALSRLPGATCAAVQFKDTAETHSTLRQFIANASRRDSWFTHPRNVKTLLKRGDCWYKGKRMVVPAAARLQVLQELHDAPYSGHRGVTKTVALISESFWWPNMREDIQKHVRTCAICQVTKAKSVKPGGQLQPLPIPNNRWESIAMDFITDLPCTPSGKDAILVFVDRLTRMVLFAPCTKDIDALGTAKLLRDYVFCQHGLPVSIVSDRDPRFTSKVWTELMKLLGTQLKMSTAFHPQTDGLTERYNRVLEEYLRSYVSSTYDDWDQWLPLAQFAVNNSKQESLKATPFFLNHGRHPRTPAAVTTNSDLPGAEEFATSLHKAIAAAKSALQAAQQRQKAFADTKTRSLEFTVGQQVLLDSRNLTLRTTGPNKLLPKYVGPFKVTARVGSVAYKLELPPTMKCHPVFHVSLLHKWNADGRHQPPPPPIAVDDGDEWYTIDNILDHKRVKRGRKFVDRYLVKWTGLGPEHNEWRDAADVTEFAIQQYNLSRTATRRRGRRQT